MALPWKARAAFSLLTALRAVGLAPTAERALRAPMAKRLGGKPAKRLLGVVPDVPTEDVTVRTRDGADIRVRLYRPAGATIPLLYAHGGGFVLGGVDSCDHICRRLAVGANAVVASVEYRLAPEHRFPGPLHDCQDALEWFLVQDLGLEAGKLVLAGDSAGGNLAAALALVLREQDRSPAGQLLIYPAVDLTVSSPEILAYRGVGLTTAECRLCADSYLGPADPRDPLASPLHAPDLSGSAPALIVTVDHDPLQAEGVKYAGRLQQDGVPVALIELTDQAHGSLSLPALYPGVDELYVQLCAFVRDPLSVAQGSAPGPGHR